MMVQAMAPHALTASSRLKLVLSPTVAVEADSTSLKPEPTALCYYVSDGARHMRVTAVTQHGTSDLDTKPPLKQRASCSGFMVVLGPNKMPRSTVTEKQMRMGLAFDQTRLIGNQLGFPKWTSDCSLCFGGRMPKLKVFAQQVLHDDIQPLTSAGGLYQ